MERGRLSKINFKQKLATLAWKPVIIILLLIMTIVAAGFIYYRIQKKAVFREQVNQLNAIADLKTAQITTWLVDRLGDAEHISENPIVKTELLAYLGERPAGQRRESIQGWLSSLRKSYHYENVLLLDRQGTVILSASALHNEIGQEGRKTLEQARQRRDTAISNMHENPNESHIHLEIITPLLANNEAAAFVLLRIDPNQFLFPLIQSWPTPSPSAETLLIRRDGEDVLFLNELRHKKNTALKLRMTVRNMELPAAQAALGRTGLFSGRDYRDIPVWSVIRPVKGTAWSIVAKVDRDEIEHPIRRNALAIFLVVFFLILSGAGLVLFFWQRQSSRFLIGQLAAETARHESEEKFKQVFETANAGKSITLPSGEINVNKAFCEMLGYSQEELQNKKWQEITPADEVGSIQKILEPLLQGQRETARFTKRYIRKDGSIVWGDVSVAIRRDANGKPLHFITTVVDISERRQAEENLQRLSERNQALLEAVPDIIMEVDADKVYTWANHAGIEFFGDDIIGKEANHYFEGEQQTYLQVQPIFNGKEDVVYIESWQRRRDGQKRLLAWWCRVLKDDAGNVIGALSSARDITEVKLSENEIRRLNEELEQRVQERTAELSDLYNNAPCGYHSLNSEGTFVLINDTELKWLGYNRGEIIGKIKFTDLLTPESIATFQRNFPVFKEQGWIDNLEFDMKRKNGLILSVLLSATAIKDAEGHYLMSRSTIIDNSEQKHAQRIMEESQTKLLAANKELEAFSYSVSHDLRAPLRAIDGFSRIILEDYAPRLDDEGRRLLDIVRSNTSKMGHLIDDLLAFSRLSRQQLAVATVNLEVMAKVVCLELKKQETGRHINFKVGTLPAARGDYAMLQQVLQNLLANAVKFTRTRVRARIEISGEAGQEENIYRIKDNGVGFDMQYLNKLFGVFQRLHSADEFEGTGVGLAIVQRIILRHGGRVWAESGKGGGATFYFSLPTEANPEMVEPPTVS